MPNKCLNSSARTSRPDYDAKYTSLNRLVQQTGAQLIIMIARRAEYSDSDDDIAIEVAGPKEKPTIKLKQWLHSFKSNNSHNLKTHIMSFLLAEGLYEVARTFSEQAGVPMPHVDEHVIRQRYEIKNLIRKGQIEQALTKIKQIDPDFMTNPKNNQLHFSLKCLKVINLIKKGSVEESIEVAKHQLLPFTKQGEQYIKQTQKVMGLLAFVDLQQCPNRQLVHQEHSFKIASKVNKHLLVSTSEQSQQALQALLKLGKWCQNRLSQFIRFPTINLQSDVQLFREPA